MVTMQQKKRQALVFFGLLLFGVVAAPVAAFRLAVTEFTVTGHESPVAIGRIIADSVVSKLSVLDNLDVLDRGSLDAVFAEQELSLSGLVDSATAVNAGRILGSAAVLTGECLIVGDEVLFTAMIIDSETGVVLYGRSSVFSGPLLSGIDRETHMMASEITIDEEGNLAGGPAALWVSRAESASVTPGIAGETVSSDFELGMEDTAEAAEITEYEAPRGPSRILIYALSDVADSVDDYGQWYLGPEHLGPVSAALAARGHEVVVHDRRTLPDLSQADLMDFHQVWIFEGDGNGKVDPTSAEAQALNEFFRNGGGVWLSGENTVDPSTSNWKEDINRYAEPFGFSIDRNIVQFSLTLPVPGNGHPLLSEVGKIVFDGEVGSIAIDDDRVKLLVPIEEDARILRPSLTYQDLFQWAQPDRYREVYESGSSYSFGWLMGSNFKKAGPRVPPNLPGVVYRDGKDEESGRLIADAGWMLGWAFTDYEWEEYREADNMTFLLNAADWLSE